DFVDPPLPADAQVEPSHIKHLSIPALGIDTPVEVGAITNGNWSVSNTGANHLNTSANVGQAGNIIVYGHNKRSILGKLPEVEVEKEILLQTDDGQQHEFIVKETYTTTPDDIRPIEPTDTERLTIYTCVGWQNSKRFIVVAERKL
ncbi:MAG: sortase, partial [Acidobacteriota bacterium]